MNDRSREDGEVAHNQCLELEIDGLLIEEEALGEWCRMLPHHIPSAVLVRVARRVFGSRKRWVGVRVDVLVTGAIVPEPPVALQRHG